MAKNNIIKTIILLITIIILSCSLPKSSNINLGDEVNPPYGWTEIQEQANTGSNNKSPYNLNEAQKSSNINLGNETKPPYGWIKMKERER